MHGVFAGCLEVLAVFDQLHTQRAHGGVFFQRVALRHHDAAGHAVCARRPAHALAVVTTRGADHLAWHLAALLQLVEIGQASANLERAHRRVVFVFDPAVGAQALAERAPAVLRRGLERPVDHLGSGFDVLQVGQLEGHGKFR